MSAQRERFEAADGTVERIQSRYLAGAAEVAAAGYDPAGVTWAGRFALCALNAGWTLPSWLLLSAQMLRNGGGCASQGRKP